MKKTVLTFGLISGVVSSLLMLATVPFIDQIGFDHGLIVGYTAIVLSFLLVFFGIRSYRDNVGGGAISLGRGLAIGVLITIISSAFYVATWEVVYFKFMPDFADKFTAHSIAQAKAQGATPEALAAKEQQGREFKAMYDKPLYNVAMTFMEPAPIGLLVTVVSAVALRRRQA
jgi:hypothetical protein